MRFKTLEDLTSLPVRQIRRQFRNEEVRSVLPARAAVNGTESLLIATTSALAIVAATSGSPRWVTRWAPWDSVHTADDVESTGQPDDGHDHHRGGDGPADLHTSQQHEGRHDHEPAADADRRPAQGIRGAVTAHQPFLIAQGEMNAEIDAEPDEQDREGDRHDIELADRHGREAGGR